MQDVLVVIGTGGMGEAIARRSGAGQQVLLADFDEAALERVGTALAGDGFAVTTQQVDVSSRDSMAALAAAAAELGPVRHVVHTAGLSPQQAPTAAVLTVDLYGVAVSLEEFGKVIAPGGAGVVIASMAGAMAVGRFPGELEAALLSTPTEELLSLPFLREGALPDSGAAYSLAKRANQLRVHAAAADWGARGARINSISPGVISTPMGQHELASENGAGMRTMIDGSGSGRIGTPADIAGAAAFLLGPDASFITGTDLLVDGGVVAAVRAGGIELPGA
ncbi:short-chain dehydrogenase [Brachybacterium sp. P6-10-X1]|uniref:SDR family oxidoreductase n=1 Tax=Brachybacterium sp. P6-10-X1 TaxID=1903186 RepID=UPI0009717CCE|nr:SDR family oxidoreductase [Brachybacterium sp. P6-10-X1]APX34035.1 short-chain dehydrogenase [Brachybacterium sp. P6-10-X1]